jgi:hypothetical protein
VYYQTLPPLSIRVVVNSIQPPISIDLWRPLVVMANPKSGGKDGEAILSSFRKLLNPVQVLDLSELAPECGLEICRLLPQHTCRILACGGDGTVGWILGAIDKANLPVSYPPFPPLAWCHSSPVPSHLLFLTIATPTCCHPTPRHWQ